jgi:signal transduction histidine kinase
LALLYALLFLAAGAALLGLSYVLVAKRLPSAPKHAASSARLPAVCRQPALSPTVKSHCYSIYIAGQRATAADQRQRTLTTLLEAAGAGLLLATMASLALGWLVAGRILQPAAEAIARRQRFLANAAHELRTPLTTMRTAIEVTLAKPTPTVKQLQDMGREVGQSVERAQATVDGMLTLSAAELGEHREALTDLQVTTGDALDAAAAVIAARELVVGASLEPAPVRGDPVLLERLAANLIENAVRYNCDGGELSVRTDHHNGSAVLEVTNTGPPVQPDDIPDLFEPFTRGNGRVSGDGGVGLGMSIAAAIATAHHGTVAARAQDRGGLRVTVTIPAA